MCKECQGIWIRYIQTGGSNFRSKALEILKGEID